MKKFIIHSLGLLLFFLASSWLLYKIEPPVEARILASIKHKQQIVNFGTSHGYDFDYYQVGLKGRNACIGANTLYYDLQNFRYYKEIDLLNDDAVVILPISYFSFGLDENRRDMLPEKSFVDFYYSYLPPKYLYDYSPQKHTEVYLYNVQENFKSLLTGNRKRPLHRKGMSVKGEKQLKKHNPFRYPGFEKMALIRASGHKKSFDSLNVKKNRAYLETLITEIQGAGHQVILVSTPFHEMYRAHFRDTWLDSNYYSIIRETSIKYGIPYFDYSRDERFVGVRACFTDPDHLSKDGKLEFNAIFFNDIEPYIRNLSPPELIDKN